MDYMASWLAMESSEIVRRILTQNFLTRLMKISFDGLAGPTATTPNWARYEILSLKECQNFFLGNFTEYLDTKLCGRGIRASTCQGDSGQALVIYRKGKKKLLGIVSNGYESCEVMGEPEIFTRVDAYLEFIENTIKDN